MNIENSKSYAMNRRKFIGKASVMSAFMIVPRFVLGGKGYIAPSDQINLGFIGTGKQGSGLKGSFQAIKEVKIVAAADVYGAKLQRFAGINNLVDDLLAPRLIDDLLR